MATDTPHNDHSPIIEEFLVGEPEEFEDLGEPPLKDRLDPLLDGERIHIEHREDDGDVENGDG